MNDIPGALRLPTQAEARRQALGIVLSQAGIAVLVTAVCFWLAGARAGWSAALGGGISVLANLALVLLAFRRRAGRDARRIARGFFVGEALKALVLVVLMVLALTLLKPEPGPMMAGFIATLLAYWLALART